MQTLLEQQLPLDFAADSRVWIYQCNRAFREKEVIEINEQLLQFYEQWESHGKKVKAWAGILFNQFIVMMADEKASALVGGCSIDSSVRIIKSLEKQYGIQLFDRMSISFLIKDKVQMLPLQQIKYAAEKGYINKDTLFFNNAITTKEELLHSWLVPIHESWLANRI